MPTPDDRGNWKTGLALASVGIEMALSMGIGYLAGDWLDTRLGTTPWLTAVFFGFGVAAAFLGLWRNARRHWPRD